MTGIVPFSQSRRDMPWRTCGPEIAYARRRLLLPTAVSMNSLAVLFAPGSSLTVFATFETSFGGTLLSAVLRDVPPPRWVLRYATTPATSTRLEKRSARFWNLGDCQNERVCPPVVAELIVSE